MSGSPEQEAPGVSLLAEVAGWYGTSAIVLAYVFVSFKVVSATGVVYQLLNLTGAIGIIVISFAKKVRQSLVLNLFWGLFAVLALLSLAVKH